MSWEDDIRHVPGIWFSKGGGSVVPIPPLAFFDTVPEELEFGLCSLYPFTQPDVLRKLVKSHPEVLDYLESHPMPGGTMERCLQWASPIGTMLFRGDYSLLYCNHLTTCHTDEVELKRAIAGLPEDIVSHWPKDLLIHVCLGNDLDVPPVSRTWAELTMSHLTSGQRFGFSLPPVTPREPTEPTAPSDAEYEAEPVVRSGPKSAIQRELDKITAGLTAEQERPARTPATTSPSRTLPPLSSGPASSAPVSPSRTAINPLWLFLIGSGVTLCALLVATHWQRGAADPAGTKHGSNNADNPVDPHQTTSPPIASSPRDTPLHPAQTLEESPLGDLIVQRPQKDEIWLACTNGSNRPVQLCEHDWRTGQVSFSPDEQWIVVTDGGGPGSSLGTELRAFHRESQNTYREATDAGIADEAADSVLHRRNAPAGTEMVHVYAQVDGWSGDGTKLKFHVWGDDGKLSGYRLEPTAVTYSMAGIGARQPAAPQQTSSQPWLTYGQNVTLHGTLLKHYHTEYLDTLPNSAEGRRSAQTPAYILRLAAPISVRAADSGDSSSDPEQNAQEIYLSSTPQGSESLIDSLIGKQVAVSGKLDHAYNVHHPRPVMIDASTLSADPDGLNKGEQEMSARQNAGTQNRAAATPPVPQESTDSDSDYALYTNRKHVYSVVLPAALASALQENASGDSVTASSNDGRIKVLLRVKQGVGTAEALYKQWTAEHTIRDPGKVVDYKTFHGNWFVVSGHDGPRGYYVKVVVRGSESLFLCLEYDEEQSSRLGAMLTRISRSFTGGIGGSSGTVVQATPPAAPGPTRTRAVDANAQPVPAAGSLSRREWRERLRKYCTIPSGHQLLSNEKRLFAVMGKPDDVEHEGRNTYWYYKCSDGVVQLAFQLDPEMMGGQIIAEVSDR